MVDDVAVVPVALVKYVMEDSKKLVEHNQRQENKIQELQFQLDLKDKQIETLEVMCENYGNQDDDMSDTASSVSYDRRSSAASSSMLRSSSSKLSQPRRPSLRKLSMAPKSKSSRRASAFSGLEGSRSSSLTDAVDMTAKLREEVNTTQNSEEYRRILMATRQISNQKTLDEAIDCILSSACRLLNCSAASLYLVDQRRRKVGVISVEKNRASVPMSVQNVQVDLRMGESIVSRVVETKEQMRIDNVDLCNFYDPVMDNRSQIAIFGMACLPIFGQEQKILGVLQALNKCRKIRTSDKHEEEDAPRFSDQDMVTMAHIGEAASSALNIVNLHSDAKLAHKRIRGLLNLLQDLSEEDSSNTVIERILAVSSRDILETERLSFFTLSADGTTLFLNCSLDTSGIKIPISHGLVGYAARNCEDLMVADAYADARFDKSVDKKTGFTTRSVMCMPVRRYGTNEVLGVIQAINKINGGCFEPEDLDLLKYVARSAGITMHRANLYRTILQNSNYTEARMRLTTVVNKNVGIDVVMHEVMDAARMFIQVQATTLYLVDQTKQELWVTGIQGVSTLRIPIGRGLAGTAAAQGTTMNIVDAYDDPTFDRSFDKKTGFRTKSVLCIPIFDKTKNGDSNRLVAVFQAINRMEGTDVIPFQHHDIKILESFCAEVAITLRYLSFEISCLKIFADSENNSGSTETAQASLLSVFTSQNMATMLSTMQNVSRATEAETSAPRITFSKIVYPDTASFEALLTWEADILSLTHREIFMFIQQAFRKLNFFQTFNITITVLQSFSETVRLKYRGNPFHNFHHGFHCFQAFYLMLQGKAFVDVFNELELLGGLVAALCHGRNYFHNKFRYHCICRCRSSWSRQLV